jgi:hypothetical protein
MLGGRHLCGSGPTRGTDACDADRGDGAGFRGKPPRGLGSSDRRIQGRGLGNSRKLGELIGLRRRKMSIRSSWCKRFSSHRLVAFRLH